MDLWEEGQRAWHRLSGWRQAPSGGEDALAALTDLGLVRRSLDQVELDAVREARGHRRSWSEIAVRLGVTRQSAWERWRDVDEAVGRASGEQESAAAIREAAIGEVARARRRAGTVKVPDVVGLSWDNARSALVRKDLVPATPDPDDLPLAAIGWPGGVVTDQSPESGAKVERGSTVTLWIDRSGGSGVREPRRPKPDPKTGRKLRDEITDDAVT
ncbi:PASTA domain-containing protein [Amycolatopsis sp. K13G38]|uniref:PASTA domain-containing protein n=1 Tax=Amycolatopsis acididurans TaxID=2724524 RepID=A0ABX1IVP9_9PSEU|nr:PASTA domain-containing protein [Amycolatopsis acididurans]NKQ51546.1 PASTA domain-containing protein [Amycolatopsis acididurans]